jgi:tRNA U34 2-thiouridine synthase MnmA/TrmU
VYVSNGYDPIAQYCETINLSDMQLLHPGFQLVEGIDIRFKIRHQPEFNTGKIGMADGKIIIRSSKPISGVAPGQFGVIYDAVEPICMGSGVIG